MAEDIMNIDPELLLDTSRGATSPSDEIENYGQYFEDRVQKMSAEEYREANFATILEESGILRITGENAKNALSEIELKSDESYLGATDKSAPKGQVLESDGTSLPGR